MPYAVCRRRHQQSRDREGAGRQIEGVIENRWRPVAGLRPAAYGIRSPR
ncbi:MAG: hypothetical protein ACR2L2_14905 [Acidobacteriota bacterium]